MGRPIIIGDIPAAHPALLQLVCSGSHPAIVSLYGYSFLSLPILQTHLSSLSSTLSWGWRPLPCSEALGQLETFVETLPQVPSWGSLFTLLGLRVLLANKRCRGLWQEPMPPSQVMPAGATGSREVPATPSQPNGTTKS